MTARVADLLMEAERRYGMALFPAGRVAGGDEARLVALESSAGRVVLRVAPAWRTVEELEWAYALAGFASGAVPEAVAPLPALDGARVFRHAGRPVSLWPWVEGERLDREDAALRDAAARLLARLHRVLPAWPQPRPRPPAARVPPRSADVPEVEDAELDRWMARRAADAGVPRGPVHGDFYRGNVLCREGRIMGLIDWDESRVDALDVELAWSVWEFCQHAVEDALDVERARRFLAAYAEAGGPVRTDAPGFVIPHIRAGLAREVRMAYAARAAGGKIDEAYMEREVRAFRNLRDQRL